MNNDYKWETIGRCKFYTDGTTCTDIEVMDDAKEISFIYPKIMINRERCQKVFSSVEIMLIGRNVISIAIPNKMFPNIKHVESKSNSFINGKYLIERAGGKLLNVFGQSEDAEIAVTGTAIVADMPTSMAEIILFFIFIISCLFFAFCDIFFAGSFAAFRTARN